MQCFKKLMTEIQNVVPDNAKHCPLSLMDFKEDLDPSSELQVRPAVGECQEQGMLLSSMPQLPTSNNMDKRALYQLCVKVRNFQ